MSKQSVAPSMKKGKIMLGAAQPVKPKAGKAPVPGNAGGRRKGGVGGGSKRGGRVY